MVVLVPVWNRRLLVADAVDDDGDDDAALAEPAVVTEGILAAQFALLLARMTFIVDEFLIFNFKCL